MPDYAPANRFEGSSSSWMLKLGFVWGGELVSVLTSSILQIGFIWHITFTTNSASMLSLASLVGFLPLALFGIWAEYSVCTEPSCRGRCRWDSPAPRSSQMLWELLHGLLERARRWLCSPRSHGRFRASGMSKRLTVI